MKTSTTRASTTVLFTTLAVLAAALAEPPLVARDSADPAGDDAAAAAVPPGYVADRVCGGCHVDLWDSYREVGMAKSFYRPSAATAIEDFDRVFYHAPSKRHYEMRLEGGRYRFRRYQLDADGEPIHELEQEVDWILGSGHRARTYLFRTPSGELYQLPLAWYSQEGRWAMAPGFEGEDHQGLDRRVRRECMFCHNAYPAAIDATPGDGYADPHVFPAALPEGTGCQRCHGPGAAHVAAANDPDAPPETLGSTIVDPGELSPERRRDVCHQCHLQPTSAISGIRRFGHGDYSYRPGDDLADYLALVDVVERDEPRAERFEINHHPYRLEQSRCFVASGGALGCLTCHDPHRKVPPAERAAHYRAACLSCHTVDACELESMGADTAGTAGTAVARDDCVGCHMPRRRPRDVIQVVMTDHLIRRQPGGPELVAPREHYQPSIEEVRFLYPERAPEGELGVLYRAATLVRAGAADAAAVERLATLVGKLRPAALEPYLDLARGFLHLRRMGEAEAVLAAVLERSPDHPLALEWLATARADRGRREEAIALYRRALERSPDRPELHFNLGFQLLATERHADAERVLERAVQLRPTMTPAWFHLGNARAPQGRLDKAADAYRRALALDPRHERGYLALARVLEAQQRPAEARRYLRHGIDVVARPDALRRALADLDSAGETRRESRGAGR